MFLRLHSSEKYIRSFHQKIFRYIDGCTVPKSGWDVIVEKDGGIEVSECGVVSRIFVEMKNKHNTMNSAASAKTYMKMQGQLLADDDCACFLVETIAKRSQNKAWTVSLDGHRQKHRRIRRVSMDEFYAIVTGESDAFYQLCMALPTLLEEVIKDSGAVNVPIDTVCDELNLRAEEVGGSLMLALYLLGFETYHGFQTDNG